MQSISDPPLVQTPAFLSRESASVSGPGRILLGVFETLDRAGISYCVLSGYEGYPHRVKSDVDCILSSELNPRQLVSLLRENRDRIGVDVIGAGPVRWLGTYLVLAGKNIDGSPCFLDLDVSPDYELAGRHFYAGSEVLASRHRHEQFWVPSARIEFGCYLLKKVLKKYLDDEQGRRLSELYQADPVGCQEEAGRFWGAGSTKLIAGAASSGDWEPVRRVLGSLSAEARRRAALRHPWHALGSWLCRAGRKVRKLFRPEAGLDVVFLGPDGAGKSSVIQTVRQELGHVFARTVCYRFPPGLISNLLGRTYPPEKRPHGSPPRSFLSSVVRAVCYWFAYYTLGYLVTIHLALARDTLVLHDRHLVDALVDPIRYRYGGPRWLLRLMWWLVPKPALVILLDAPAEVIQARKQEVPLEETARQREAYLSLVTPMSNGHVVDASRPQEQVAGDVMDVILQHLAVRTADRTRLEQKA